jgi:hypothetical protein
MKKSIEKSGDFEIEWTSASRTRIVSQGHGLMFYLGEGFENVIGFIVGWEWYRRETNHVKVRVLRPRSMEWDNLSTDPRKVLEDVKERVRTVLKAPDGKLCGEIKKNIYTLGNC